MGSRVLAQRYELLDKIGEGGMAVVFRAKDLLLDRFVALKILRPEFIKDEAFIESFRRESQLVAGIVDPNIVTVYDVGQQGNIYYIVMELVEGETLSEIIKREGKLDAHRCASYARQIAMALSTAHHNNLIHRDIKPHNIMVTNDGVAKLMDFGIAKRVTNNTLVGDEKEAVMGSIHYFSPEQARGLKVDERSDIYSLGIVMYEMITGKVPFDGENAVEVAVKHMNEEMVEPCRLADDIPQDIQDIIMKATAKDPERRYNSAEEMITDLNFVKFSKIAEPTVIDENPGTEDDTDDDDDDVIVVEKGSEGGKKNRDEEAGGKKKFNWATLAAVLLAIVLAIPVSKLLSKKITGADKEPDTTVIPHLEDMLYDDAKAALEKIGLGITIEQQIPNDNKEPGTILSYTPSEGTTVKKGQTVKVNISKKSQDKTVPSLVMTELSSAKKRIEQNGFTVGEVTKQYDENIPKGYVISSDPGEGTSLEKGGKVNLCVSDGVDPSTLTTFTLNLYNMTEAEAIEAVEARGCTYEVLRRANTSVEEGHVFLQSPVASYEVEIEKAAETKYIIYVSNTGSSQQNIDPDDEKTVTLNMDMSLAETDPFDLTVTVNFNDGDVPRQPYLRTPVSKTGDEMFGVDIYGVGRATATVSFGNRLVYIFDVNFDTGVATATYAYSAED